MISFYGFANPQEEDKIVKEKSRNEYTRHVPFGVSHRARNPQPAKTTHGRPLEEMTCWSARTSQSVDRKPLRHQVLIPIRVAESVARRRILGLHATVCPLWDKQCRTSLRMPPQTPRPMFDAVLSTDNPQRKETSLPACGEVQTQPLFLSFVIETRKRRISLCFYSPNHDLDLASFLRSVVSTKFSR